MLIWPVICYKIMSTLSLKNYGGSTQKLCYVEYFELVCSAKGPIDFRNPVSLKKTKSATMKIFRFFFIFFLNHL